MFKNWEGKVRSGWKIAAVMGTSAAIIFIAIMLFGLIVSVAAMAKSGQTGDPFDDVYMTMMADLEWIVIVMQDVIIIVVAVFAWTKILKKPLRDMGLDSLKNHGREFGAGLLLGIAAMAFVFINIVLYGGARVVSWHPQFSAAIVIDLALFIVVGFSEEILGRGYIMSVLRQTKSVFAVVVISSLTFSLLHLLNNGFTLMPLVNIALAGALFAYMYIKSGNIWMPIGFHITWNYFQGDIFGFAVSGIETESVITTVYTQNNIVNGGVFGPEGGVVATAVMLLCLLVVKWYYRSSRYDFLAGKYDGGNDGTASFGAGGQSA